LADRHRRCCADVAVRRNASGVGCVGAGRRGQRHAAAHARALRFAGADPDGGPGRQPQRVGGGRHRALRDAAPEAAAREGMKGEASLADVRAWLAAARRVVVFTGAGVSAESGIPTFRDALTGLWARYDPERLATEAGFRADPALVWRWYAERRDAIGAAQPNAAHRAIAASESRGGSHITVVTQNIDGLHARAGSRDVLELHGSILRARCLEGCGDPAHLAPGYDWRG